MHLLVEPTESMAAQDFLMFSTQVLEAFAKALVRTSLKASHGVIPVNCQIGADAAKALKTGRPHVIF